MKVTVPAGKIKKYATDQSVKLGEKSFTGQAWHAAF
jgi:hypothetical protein